MKSPDKIKEETNALLDVENLSSRLHQVYEKEIERQGKKSKHPKMYFELSEDVKNLDRALAKYIIEFIIPSLLQARDREIIEKINGIKVVGMSLEECKCCFARNKALQDIITTLTGEDNE
jgi:hypothetical protein